MADLPPTIRAILAGQDDRLTAIESAVTQDAVSLAALAESVASLSADVAAIRDFVNAIQIAVLNLQQSVG